MLPEERFEGGFEGFGAALPEILQDATGTVRHSPLPPSDLYYSDCSRKVTAKRGAPMCGAKKRTASGNTKSDRKHEIKRFLREF
jgi:hypothetical protein